MTSVHDAAGTVCTYWAVSRSLAPSPKPIASSQGTQARSVAVAVLDTHGGHLGVVRPEGPRRGPVPRSSPPRLPRVHRE